MGNASVPEIIYLLIVWEAPLQHPVVDTHRAGVLDRNRRLETGVLLIDVGVSHMAGKSATTRSGLGCGARLVRRR